MPRRDIANRGQVFALNYLAGLAQDPDIPPLHNLVAYDLKRPVACPRVAFIGTSLVQQSDAATSGKLSHWSRGWITQARIRSNGRFVSEIWHDPAVYAGWEPSGVGGSTRSFMGYNVGVSGQVADQIIARMGFLEKLNPDIVVVDVGTNEMATVAKEEILAKRIQVCDYARSLGSIVILLPILARAVSVWGAGTAARAKANWINAKSREYATVTPGVLIFDWNRFWVDPGSANGEPVSGYSVDGTHFNPLGAAAVGQGFADFLAGLISSPEPRLSSPDDRFDAAENPFGNIFTNGFLIGSSGTVGTGVTGTVATGMRVERTVGATATGAATIEASTNSRGNRQVLTITPGGTGEHRFLIRSATADTSHVLPAGTWVRASMEVEFSAYNGWLSQQLYLKDNPSGMIAYANEEYDNSGLVVQPGGWSGLLETPPIRLVEGSNALRWRLEVAINGAVAGSPVVKCGAIRVSACPPPVSFGATP